MLGVTTRLGSVKELIGRITAVPWVAHLLRANERFTERLGNQFGAAITYFSVLAIVPILMLAVAIVGIVLGQVPALRQQATQTITDLLSQAPKDVADQVDKVIGTYLDNYAAIGIVGLLSAVYAGSNWIGNLKSAVRAQWRPDFDEPEQKRMIVLEILVNFGILLSLLVLVAVTGAVSSVATTASSLVSGLLGLDQIPGGVVLVRVAPVVISIGVGWVLFMFVYQVMPQNPVTLRTRMRGALIGAIGLAALQYLTGILFSTFANNTAAKTFGPIIVLMLFLNLFARLILFVAAWIATDEVPTQTTREAAVAAIEGQTEGPLPPPPLTSGLPATAKISAIPVDGQTDWTPGGGQDYVPQKVAVRSVRIGLGAGYVTGTATGIGLGAVVAVLVGKVVDAITGRRKTKSS